MDNTFNARALLLAYFLGSVQWEEINAQYGEPTPIRPTTVQPPPTQPTCNAITDFQAFNGQPAKIVSDCVWDFFGCRKDPAYLQGGPLRSAQCCDQRFDNCCRFIMDPQAYLDSLPQSDTQAYPQQPPPETTTTTTTTTTEKPYYHSDSLIGCVWQFNGCVEGKLKAGISEAICYERFEECKMILMGMIPRGPSPSTGGGQYPRGPNRRVQPQVVHVLRRPIVQPAIVQPFQPFPRPFGFK
eukprot:maker-scaffold361_size196684-snap-gene-0.22 protein:Tk09266 transcript:maker-scaffold361_size196684-snap-gene-0.22-mRNA-1 annotation:"conserved hypothetical protein"